jgi:pimeloyl-ACP methyl ester carboxylesterase
MPVLYFTWALLLLLAAPAGAQQAQPPAGSYGYTVFLRGVPIGREDVTVRRDQSGVTIAGSSRLTPVNVAVTRAEMKYRSDWVPDSLILEYTINGADVALRTAFKDGTATTEGVEAGQRVSKTDMVSSQAVILPSFFFGAYEALGRQLANVIPGDELHAYIAPQAELTFKVRNVTADRMQTGTTTFNVRSYELVFMNPDGELAANLSVDENGVFIRLSVPLQSLDVVRDDLASSTSRTRVYSNAGDEAAVIPAAGFNLGATLTRPKQATGRLPAVILLGGAGIDDRDGYIAGIPMLGQLAGTLADAGFVAVRYDKRGAGQSGGRAESAALQDYAEDVRSVVKWLAARQDIDPKRIAIAGHGQGAWVALLAASRENRIAAVVSLAAPATNGTELTLEQQRDALQRSNASPAERDAKVALQKQIQTAVLTGKGWEGVPRNVRTQADTPLFQSILSFDPARVIDDIRQPMLFIHGQLDREVPVEHVERLSQTAQKESKSKVVEVVSVRGINHLLVPAITGEINEYGALPDRTISKDVTVAITGWLMRTLVARR